jgi:hypothetical protein
MLLEENKQLILQLFEEVVNTLVFANWGLDSICGIFAGKIPFSPISGVPDIGEVADFVILHLHIAQNPS